MHPVRVPRVHKKSTGGWSSSLLLAQWQSVDVCVQAVSGRSSLPCATIPIQIPGSRPPTFKPSAVQRLPMSFELRTAPRACDNPISFSISSLSSSTLLEGVRACTCLNLILLHALRISSRCFHICLHCMLITEGLKTKRTEQGYRR